MTMDTKLKTAAVAGYERVSAWADLLDDINVYPVPDADTGRNLKISLAPIRDIPGGDGQISTHLLRAATGNSGNIAAAFFSEFLAADSAGQLAQKASAGNGKAWAAVADPQPGTMLSVFESLSRALTDGAAGRVPADIVKPLIETVRDTGSLLPALQKAGVVDSGALGMFLFFEGFFRTLLEENPGYLSPFELFGKKLRPARMPVSRGPDEVCISALIKTGVDPAQISGKLQTVGRSVVAFQEGHHLKVHLHASDLDKVRQEVSTWGDLINCESETIMTGPRTGALPPFEGDRVHIVTDAAGSITRQTADSLDLTLMDSYIITADRACPETAVTPAALYEQMRTGRRVSTAQTSLFERQQTYESLCSRFEQVVYLCVGSAYTSIYQAARDWQKANQARAGGLTVLDSGAASGRLGLTASAVAEFANRGKPLAEVVAYAKAAFANCRELVFLDQLKYLVAGGRISRTGGFFGDLFGVKPVISPLADGIKKIGVVHKSTRQVPLALEYFTSRIESGSKARILLQYTDNRNRVTAEIQPAIKAAFPRATITLTPLSLTSGVHMGPGTWAMAVLPEI